MAQKTYAFLFTCLVHLEYGAGTIHKLEMKSEDRPQILLSTFGFYKGGLLDVQVTNLHVSTFNGSDKFGFSLDRTLSDAMNPYLDSHQEDCLLQQPSNQEPNGAVAYFTLDLHNKMLLVNCGHELQSIHIYKSQSDIPLFRPKRANEMSISHTNLFRQRRSTGATNTALSCSQQIRITSEVIEGKKYFNANFVMFVATEREEGLYNLYFHNCPNYKERPNPVSLDFIISIEEKNGENYLSAGEMPLPALYFIMALLFFLSGCFWVFILKKSRHPVYKVHYFMTILVYVKCLSLILRGINYEFNQRKGEPVAAWAILYYVFHLLKSTIFCITLVLIATGWTFIKDIKLGKYMKIFIILISLQVLANVAEINVEETEEGAIEHHTWRQVFILADLMGCGILIWSIFYLQRAPHADEKAFMNLRKFKLFRHYNIIILCYIYFTRIIVYLLKITLSFQYEWVNMLFLEMTTYIFFVLTGCKFQPASANPYFQVANEDDEDVVFSQSAFIEGMSEIAHTTKEVNNELCDEENYNLLVKGKVVASMVD